MNYTINRKKFIASSQIVLSMGLLLFYPSCSKENKHAEGEKLARVHCASCHMFPDPSILPRKVWGEKILPNMGLLMGMSHGPIYSYGDPASLKDLCPTISQDEWNKIVHYYLNRSENSTPKHEIKDQERSDLFQPHLFSIDSVPLVTMTFFDHKSQKLFLGDANSSSLLTLNMNGDILSSEKLPSPPVKKEAKDSLDYLLTIGDLSPSDDTKGRLSIGNDYIDGLARPVDFLIRDLNSDGYNDVLVCNYGNNVGDFSLYVNLGNGTYEKKVIHPLSGAIKVEMTDIDGDENDEIVVLFAQEHESVMIWEYETKAFKDKKVVQFQPAFGSVDFQLRDMDGDGLKDIVIGNGDNSDLSTVLKNFHGVRVLLNKGNKEFSEDYFFPIHGVSKIVVEDFDLDGDNDILTISNFGDFSDARFKSVQLLLNEGGLKFKPEYIKDLPDFRWQTIDVSDYDSDADLDVFLGSFNLNVGPEESDISDRQPISWVRLENKAN